jgi:hypothetical protein
MKNRGSPERCQAVSLTARTNLALENEDEISKGWNRVHGETGEHDLMIFNGMVYLVLCVVTGELVEFCRRRTAGDIRLIQRELIRSAPSEYRKGEQQKEPTTRRPNSSSSVGRDIPLIVIR